ncbi:hypothetical protein AVEN_106616-1 [Araneus ventricosus]|uniref:Uncharacterized protein n=1 Tax=Araneus ventricosus TaxID=182803 RepID=A0A4Y2I5H1_ARAVE|nr:hypothetical protein AVEN_106616-1 [Araneus ventricosus]
MRAGKNAAQMNGISSGERVAFRPFRVALCIIIGSVGEAKLDAALGDCSSYGRAATGDLVPYLCVAKVEIWLALAILKCRILHLFLIIKQDAPKLRNPLISRFLDFRASISKPAQTKQASAMPEPSYETKQPTVKHELGDDMEGPTRVNWELSGARWYLGMMHYFMEREKFDRENEIRKAFSEPPIPSFEYAV